jgi:hypothetical protein
MVAPVGIVEASASVARDLNKYCSRFQQVLLEAPPRLMGAPIGFAQGSNKFCWGLQLIFLEWNLEMMILMITSITHFLFENWDNLNNIYF